MMISSNNKVGHRPFPPVSLDGKKGSSKPHVTVGLEERISELCNRVPIVIKGTIERKIKQAGRAMETLVVLAKLDDSEWSARLPIALEAFVDIEAPSGGFTADMKSGFLPQAESSSH